MFRLLIILGLVVLGFRTLFGVWPWDYLRGSHARSGKTRRGREDANMRRAREILDVPQGASAEAIKAAYKRRIARIHPDKGGSAEQVHEASAARDALLAPLAASANEKPGAPQE